MRGLTLTGLFTLVVSLQPQAQMGSRNYPWEWVGCYQMSVAPADQALEGYGKMPRHFQLVWNKAPIGRDAFELRALDVPGRWWLSSWNLRYDRKLEIHWGTGFVGYDLTLTEAGNILSGRAQPFSDTDPPEHMPQDFPVDVRRVACGPEPRK